MRRSAVGGTLAAVTLPANVSGGSNTTYNADNEQTKIAGIALSYDANGNLTSGGGLTYTWDARNHLTGISGWGTASFVYDAFGRTMFRRRPANARPERRGRVAPRTSRAAVVAVVVRLAREVQATVRRALRGFGYNNSKARVERHE